MAIENTKYQIDAFKNNFKIIFKEIKGFEKTLKNKYSDFMPKTITNDESNLQLANSDIYLSDNSDDEKKTGKKKILLDTRPCYFLLFFYQLTYECIANIKDFI